MIPLSIRDVNQSFVLALHELDRRPGTTDKKNLMLPAPGDLALGGVVGVPEGAELQVDLTLESVVEGVLASGVVRAPYAGECGRCLDTVEGTVTSEFQELYLYPENVDNASDSEDLRVEEESVNLEQPLRDAIVLSLPSTPVCRDDCPGLCSICGARLVDDPEHTHDTIDPRWASLQGLLASEKNSADQPRSAETEES